MPETCTIHKSKKSQKLKAGSHTPTAHIMSEELANQVTRSILLFSLKIKSVPEVKKFAYKVKGYVITIWYFINSPSPAQLKKMHAIEVEMIECCQDINFDFTVIFKANETCPSGFNDVLL